MDYDWRLMIRSVWFVNHGFESWNMFMSPIDGQWLTVDEFSLTLNAT